MQHVGLSVDNLCAKFHSVLIRNKKVLGSNRGKHEWSSRNRKCRNRKLTISNIHGTTILQQYIIILSYCYLPFLQNARPTCVQKKKKNNNNQNSFWSPNKKIGLFNSKDLEKNPKKYLQKKIILKSEKPNGKFHLFNCALV